jgi:hypothetical protein
VVYCGYHVVVHVACLYDHLARALAHEVVCVTVPHGVCVLQEYVSKAAVHLLQVDNILWSTPHAFGCWPECMPFEQLRQHKRRPGRSDAWWGNQPRCLGMCAFWNVRVALPRWLGVVFWSWFVAIHKLVGGGRSPRHMLPLCLHLGGAAACIRGDRCRQCRRRCCGHGLRSLHDAHEVSYSIGGRSP